MSPTRIITTARNGGAAIAAQWHADKMGVPLTVANPTLIAGFIEKATNYIINSIFLRHGEDFIKLPISFFGQETIQDGDELHWILSPGVDFNSIENKTISIYCHDEWWSTGFNAYKTDSKSSFVNFPGLLPKSRSRFRKIISDLCRKRIFKLTKNSKLYSPSRFLANAIGKELDRQVVVRKNPFPKQAPLKNAPPSSRDIWLVFYCPDGSWYRKGSDISLALIKKAFPYAINRNKKIVIIGSYGIEQLQSLISKSPEHITCYEKISHRNMLSIFSTANLFIFPTRRDNYPNVCLESISMGCSVIVSEECGASEIASNKIISRQLKDFESGAIIDELL